MTDLTHDQHDDAFHEIHLSGKQLVFLFMATTVISVVIFLCGVAVGRSVQGDGSGAGTGLLAAQAEPEAQREAEPELPAPERVAEAAPPVPVDGVGYVDRLTREQGAEKVGTVRPNPPAERRAPPAEEPAPEPERPAPASKPEPERTAPSASAGGARPGTWAVQVISVRDRGAAEQIVRRLRTKEYPAYLVAPVAGAPSQLYKVQVGRYGDRSEAQTVETRLKKEEQFETWIVR